MSEEDEPFPLRLQRISDANRVVPLREAVMDTLGLFGVSGAYFLAPLTGDARVGRILTVIGLSNIWERHYRHCLNICDPLPQLALGRSGPFFWPTATDEADLDANQRRYMEISARFGLRRGVGVACYGPHGRAGFLGVAWPEDGEDPSDRDMLRIHTIGQLSFQRYCDLIRSDDEVPALSNRELEVLHWMSQGKSNSVIAQLLEISPSSVDAYARRIFGKLKVSDRTTASLKAFSLGLVLSADHQRLLNEAAAREPNSRL